MDRERGGPRKGWIAESGWRRKRWKEEGERAVDGERDGGQRKGWGRGAGAEKKKERERAATITLPSHIVWACDSPWFGLDIIPGVRDSGAFDTFEAFGLQPGPEPRTRTHALP